MTTTYPTFAKIVAVLLGVGALAAASLVALAEQPGSSKSMNVRPMDIANLQKHVDQAERRLVEECTDEVRLQRVAELVTVLDRLALAARSAEEWEVCYTMYRRIDRIAHIRKVHQSAEVDKSALDTEPRILLLDEQMLHGFLSDGSAAEAKRIEMVNQLEAYVVEEHKIGLYVADAATAPERLIGPLREITAKRNRYVQAMNRTGDPAERKVLEDKYLETFSTEAEVWRESGHAAQAVAVLDQAQHEEGVFGRAGSERSMYEFRYRHAVTNVLTTGVGLLDILHSADFTLDAKQQMLADLRENIRKDYFKRDDH
jgi:hypothetical protein